MKKTIFEEMGGNYIRHGDYLIPYLTLPKEEGQRIYRRMRTKTFVVFERVLQDCISESVYKWPVEWLFSGYRRTGTGDYGTVKGGKSDGMDSENKQYTSVCKGDCG